MMMNSISNLSRTGAALLLLLVAVACGYNGDGHPGVSNARLTGEELLPVNLGTAGNYVILAKAGISTVPTSDITGGLGVSPAAASSITGFALTLDSSNVLSTSSQVTGSVYAAD